MRAFPPHALLVFMGLVLVLVVTACGGTSSTGAPASTPTTATTPTPTAAPTPTPTTAKTFTVKTAQVTVKGKATTILTTAHGRTLYYFTPETASKTACTRACAKIWPPLLFTGTGKPTASTHLTGV